MTEVSPIHNSPTDWFPGGNLSSIAKEVEFLVNRQLKGLQEQEKKVAELRREVCAEEAKNKKMKEAISKCNRKIDVTMDKVEEYATTAENLKQEIRDNISHCCNLECEEKKKQAAIEDLQRWHTEYHGKMEQVREAAEKHFKECPASLEIAIYKEKILQLQEQQEQLNACMDVESSDMTALDQEVCHLQKRVAKATAQISDMKNEIDKMNNSFAARLRNLELAVFPKEKELEQMRSQLAYLTSQAAPFSPPLVAPRIKALDEEWGCLTEQLQKLLEDMQTSPSPYNVCTAKGSSFSPIYQNTNRTPSE